MSLRKHAVAAIALGGAVLAVYASSFEAGLVLDNAFIIRRATRVHAATWANVAEILTTDYWWPFNVHGVYRPLATLSYLFNWAVLGNAGRPAGYHAVNLALHWGNSILVYALGRRVLGLGGITAFLVALLFATHPVATEAVTNVVGRADLLAAASVLGGVLLYAQAARAPTPAVRRLWLAAVAATAFLGLLSKESAVVLVGAIAVYDLVFELPAAEAMGWRERASLFLRTAGPRWLALVPPLLAVWLIRWWVFHRTPPWTIGVELNALAGTDFWTARLTACAALARAVWILLWPSRLCPDYSLDEIALVGWPLDGGQDWQALLGLIGSGLAMALFLLLRGRNRPASFFLGFFLAALLPTSNLLFLSTTLLAERLLYLPLVGFCGCAVLGVEAIVSAAERLARGAPRVRAPRGLASACACGLLVLIACAYGARTARRNLDWRDDVTLFTAALESCPASYRSHELLAAALLDPLNENDPRIGEIDRVIALQERAVEIVERSAPGGAVPPTVLERLAFLYYRKARLVEQAGDSPVAAVESSALWATKAADTFERAAAGFRAERDLRRRAYGASVDASPDLAGPLLFDTLGMAQLRAARPERAIEAFVEASERAPWDPAIHEHLATAYHRAGHTEEALISLLQAAGLAPERTDLGSAVIAVDRQLRPGQCGFSLDENRLSFEGECADAHRYACVAYARLLRSLDGAPEREASRSQEVARRVRAVADRLRCAELESAKPGGS